MSRAKLNLEATYQSPRGAAIITGFGVTYIRNGCREGNIPHIKVGNDYKINMSQWLSQLEREAANSIKGGG